MGLFCKKKKIKIKLKETYVIVYFNTLPETIYFRPSFRQTVS